jgi:hypothetical protein
MADGQGATDEDDQGDCGQRHQRGEGQRRRTPVGQLAEGDDQRRHPDGQRRRTPEVDRLLRPVIAGRDAERGTHHDQARHRSGDRERGPQAHRVDEEPADRIPDPDAGRRRDRERSQGPDPALGRKVVPSDRHGHRHQTQPDSLERATGQEHTESERQGGGRTTGGDGAEGGDDHLAPVPAVGEATEHRCDHRAGEERGGEAPLRRTEGHVVVVGDGGHHRRAQAAHHGHGQPDGDQLRHQESFPPAATSDDAWLVHPQRYSTPVSSSDACHRRSASASR